jgi:hypothetical protein
MNKPQHSRPQIDTSNPDWLLALWDGSTRDAPPKPGFVSSQIRSLIKTFGLPGSTFVQVLLQHGRITKADITLPSGEPAWVQPAVPRSAEQAAIPGAPTFEEDLAEALAKMYAQASGYLVHGMTHNVQASLTTGGTILQVLAQAMPALTPDARRAYELACRSAAAQEAYDEARRQGEKNTAMAAATLAKAKAASQDLDGLKERIRKLTGLEVTEISSDDDLAAILRKLIR